jgi:hypothetical protein
MMDSENQGRGLQVERLVDALCERLAEVLPPNRFEVTVDHRRAVRIRGLGKRKGDTVWLMPIAIWKSQLPAEDRLEIFLETAGRRVQRFVSRHNQPWPTMTAKTKVLIDEDTIVVWWGGVCRADAVVALRPISRKEIGV